MFAGRDGKKSPCTKCENRHLACHDSCKDYKEFYDNLRKEKDYEKKMRIGHLKGY